MCDLNEEKLEAMESMEMSKKKAIANGGICMKCKVAKAMIIIRGSDPLCKECFLVYATHKFRSTLGKAKLIKGGDKVLLAVSGGNSSVCMLHLVKEALSEGAHKRLKFTPGIIFIDEYPTVTTAENESCNRGSSIELLANEYGYPYYYVPIHEGYNGTDASDTGQSDLSRFQNTYQSLTSLTAQTDFIESLRLSQIVKFAKKHQYGKVMMGDNATTLSIKLLCNVAHGRGESIPLDIGVADLRYEGLTIIRPLRELNSKEVAIYNRTMRLSVDPVININTKTADGASIQRQTEAFINGLQVDFTSTVNTVFRTGDKLTVNEGVHSDKEQCVLCQAPAFRSAIDSSSQGNGELCVTKDAESSCCGKSDECTSNRATNQLSRQEILACFCYGCQLTFKDMNYNLDLLPPDVLDSIHALVKRQKLKSSIEEFLID